jgi:hypothetical protein
MLTVDILQLSALRSFLCGEYPATELSQFCSAWVLSFEFYVTTDGQPASLSWYKAPIWGLRPDFYHLCDSYGLVLVGRPLWREDGSDFNYMLLALASAISLGSKSLGTRDHILLSHIWDFPFRPLLRLAGSWWRYSIPPPQLAWGPHYIASGRTQQKTPLSTVFLLLLWAVS